MFVWVFATVKGKGTVKLLLKEQEQMQNHVNHLYGSRTVGEAAGEDESVFPYGGASLSSSFVIFYHWNILPLSLSPSEDLHKKLVRF